jgi:hypothetical protein
MHVMYCALRIGFLDEVMIDYMVVPFHTYPFFRSIYVYRLDVLCDEHMTPADSTTTPTSSTTPTMTQGTMTQARTHELNNILQLWNEGPG